jgi:hypothetical protein
LARFAERAVARFIKLMQAIRRMNTATKENNLTYSILPPSCLPPEKLEYR